MKMFKKFANSEKKTLPQLSNSTLKTIIHRFRKCFPRLGFCVKQRRQWLVLGAWGKHSICLHSCTKMFGLRQGLEKVLVTPLYVSEAVMDDALWKSRPRKINNGMPARDLVQWLFYIAEMERYRVRLLQYRFSADFIEALQIFKHIGIHGCDRWYSLLFGHLAVSQRKKTFAEYFRPISGISGVERFSISNENKNWIYDDSEEFGGRGNCE